MSIEQKIEQMYRALEEMEITEKLHSVKPEFKGSPGRFSVSFDFTKGADVATAANRTSQLVANIACLKDHLKVWCSKQNRSFMGDALIDSNREVAIVHDLWNLDKHGKLDRSRSALYPRLASPPRSTIVMKVTEVGQQPMMVIPMMGGPISTKDGASLRIVADVLDKHGNRLGGLEEICEKAIAAWESEFKKAGLTF